MNSSIERCSCQVSRLRELRHVGKGKEIDGIWLLLHKIRAQSVLVQPAESVEPFFFFFPRDRISFVTHRTHGRIKAATPATDP